MMVKPIKLNLEVILKILIGLITILAFFPMIRNYLYLFIAISSFYYFLLLFFNNEKIHYSKDKTFFFFFFISWLCLSLVSYLWAKDKTRVIESSFLIFIDLTIFFFVNRMLKNENSFKVFIYIVLGITSILLIIAFWELFTWNHLSVSRFVKKNMISFIPTGPFTNENDLASIFLLNSTIFLFSIKKFKNIIIKSIFIVAIIVSFIIIIIQGARIAIIIFGINLLIYVLIFIKHKSKIKLILFAMICILIISSMYVVEYELFKKVFFKQIESISSDRQRLYRSSLDIRIELVKKAIYLAHKSYYLGVGAGNYESNMTYEKTINTGGIVNSHNFAFELLATSGLLVFLYFIIILFYLVSKFVLLLNYKADDLLYVGFFTLITFCFAIALPSSIIRYNFYWVYFAFIISILEYGKHLGYNQNIV